MRRTVTYLLLVFALAAVQARADLITNGSFENTGGTFVSDANHVDLLASGSTAIPGWTTINGVPTAWLQNGNPYGISASNGSFFLDLTGYADSGTYGGVMQTFATTAGTKYVVTFDLGYGGASGFFGGPVKLTASAAGTSATFTSGSGTPNPAVWNSETFTFTATSATTTLDLVGLSTAGGEYIGLDNVDVEEGSVSTPAGPVPEPGTYVLLLTGIGLFGCAAGRRVFS
ncbi:MAG TPA: DUF642 domain-containing protein [Edaphobacter sp.]